MLRRLARLLRSAYARLFIVAAEPVNPVVLITGASGAGSPHYTHVPAEDVPPPPLRQRRPRRSRRKRRRS